MEEERAVQSHGRVLMYQPPPPPKKKIAPAATPDIGPFITIPSTGGHGGGGGGGIMGWKGKGRDVGGKESGPVSPYDVDFLPLSYLGRRRNRGCCCFLSMCLFFFFSYLTLIDVC